MQHHGQVEENDAKNLLAEIDEKIFALKEQNLHGEEVMDNTERIAQ